MTDYVGQQFGNYRLIRSLGEGGFAKVYLAEHIHLGTHAAIKVLQTRLASDDIERFRTEARTIARLEHPQIVRVLDFDVEDKTPFLVLSYAPNGTLRQRHCKGSRLPLSTIVGYILQVANALQYAHQRRVIHRDVKPENMLLGYNDEVLLSDFGLAVVYQSTSFQSIQNLAGTRTYMAPEQFQGRSCPASDQYALGVVVYEWLCGDAPFHGTRQEIEGQHQFASPPPLREKGLDISPVLEQVVLQALAKNPGERFESVQAFAAALEQASQGARPPIVISPNPSIVLSQVSPPEQLPLSPRSRFQRRTLLIGLAGLIATGVAGDIAWRLEQQNIQHPYNTPSPTPTTKVLNVPQHGTPSPTPTVTSTSTPTPEVTSTTTPPPPVTDTPMFGYDPQHTRFNPYETLLTPTNVSSLVSSWTATVCPANNPYGVALMSTPAVVNNVVYIGSYDHKLYAINASTGQVKWTAPTAGDVESSPAVSNGVVYVGSFTVGLYAFDAATGNKHWAANTTSTIYSSPVVVDGVVYISTADGNLYAFDTTGTRRWIRAVSTGNINSSPAVANGVVYIGSDDGNLYAFDAFTGNPLWTFPTGGPIRSSPAVVNGVVFIGSKDGNLYAVNATTGHQVWVFSTGSPIRSSPAVANGVVYIGSDDGKFYAVKATTGKQVWYSLVGTGGPTGGGDIASSPMVANGVVYAGFPNNQLYAFDATSGQPLWTRSIPNAIESSPTVANGVVYVAALDGKLYTFHLPR